MIRRIRRQMAKAQIFSTGIAAAPVAAIFSSGIARADFATEVGAFTVNMSPAEAMGIVVLGAVGAVFVIKTVVGLLRGKA